MTKEHGRPIIKHSHKDMKYTENDAYNDAVSSNSYYSNSPVFQVGNKAKEIKQGHFSRMIMEHCIATMKGGISEYKVPYFLLYKPGPLVI
tara:strand:- start:42187 stop:42456 length:270 start_codon:yes stop_codon:yes gene_type:complete